MANDIIYGLTEFTVNGVAFEPMAGSFDFARDQIVTETVNGATTASFAAKGTVTPGYIEVTLLISPSLNPDEIASWRNVTIVATTREPAQIIGQNMGQRGQFVFNEIEGTVALRFEGPSVRKRSIGGGA